MIGGNDKITKGQNAGLIIGTVLGVGVLSLPRDLANATGPDGTFILVIATIFVVLLVLMNSKVALKYPGKTVVGIMEELLPKPIKIIFVIILMAFYLGAAASVLRVFSSIINRFVLQQTPLEIIMGTMLLAATYVVRKGIEPIARLVQIVLPLALIPFFLISLALIPDLDFTNILPVLQIGPKDIFEGLRVALYSFIGTEIILVSTAYVNDTNKILRYNILSTVFLGVLYMFVFVVTITQFGVEQTKDILWPTLLLMKTVNIPGAFLENVDGIFITIWTMIAVQSLATLFIHGDIILSKTLNLKEVNFMIMPLIPIVYLLALLPQNIAEVSEYMNAFSNYIGVASAIVIPVTIFIVSLFKKKGAKKA